MREMRILKLLVFAFCVSDFDLTVSFYFLWRENKK